MLVDKLVVDLANFNNMSEDMPNTIPESNASDVIPHNSAVCILLKSRLMIMRDYMWTSPLPKPMGNTCHPACLC